MATAPYPNPQAIFYQQYEYVRRDEVVGILLALFLGGLARTTSTCGVTGSASFISASSGRRFRGY
jgi:hypothetical protein